ncbi:MAG: cysteine hydrolase [Peptococcaceae bacterium]
MNALMVIDMLKDFLEPQGALYCGEAARQIIPFVTAKVMEFRQKEQPVIFIMDAHQKDDLEFNRFPVHCLTGSRGAELIGELANQTEEYALAKKIFKQRYSGFYGTPLAEILNNLAPGEVQVMGVCTNICVLYTVEELCNRDYKVVVYRQGVASFDLQAHNWALAQMESVLGAKVL